MNWRNLFAYIGIAVSALTFVGSLWVIGEASSGLRFDVSRESIARGGAILSFAFVAVLTQHAVAWFSNRIDDSTQ